MSAPVVEVRDDRIILRASTTLTPREAVGLIGKLTEALIELWPELKPGWESDARRTVVGSR